MDGHLGVINYLLNAEGDVTAKDNDGMNAIIYPSQNEHFDVVDYLMNHGGDANVETKEGVTAF